MIWEVSTGEVKADLKARTGVVCGIAVAPDGKSLALGGSDGTVVLLDLLTKAVRAEHRGHWSPDRDQGHRSAVTSVAFSPDGKTLATSSKDNDIKLWDVATGRETASFREGIGSGWADRSCYIAFAPDGQTILSVSEMKVRLRDLRSGKITATRDLSLGGCGYYIEKYVFSLDCATLAGIGQPMTSRPMGEEWPPEEGVVFLWDIATLVQTAAGQ